MITSWHQVRDAFNHGLRPVEQIFEINPILFTIATFGLTQNCYRCPDRTGLLDSEFWLLNSASCPVFFLSVPHDSVCDGFGDALTVPGIQGFPAFHAVREEPAFHQHGR